jgi:hypothetical protein
MGTPLAVGDPVTVVPPFDLDPIVVAMQSHAKVAGVLPMPVGPDQAVYMIELDGTYPAGQQFGPFSANRLVRGWEARSGGRP